MPLTALWIMPWGLAAYLLMPLGLESLALVPMGYPTVPFSQPQRIPVDQVTHWDRWGEQRERPASA